MATAGADVVVLAKNAKHNVLFSSLPSEQSAGSVPSHQNRASMHSIPLEHSHSSDEQSVVVVVVSVAEVVVLVLMVTVDVVESKKVKPNVSVDH